MESWGERIKFERERLSYGIADFAEACNVATDAQAAYERSEQEPGLLCLQAMDRLGVDVPYVLTGMHEHEDWAYLAASNQILVAIEALLELDKRKLDGLMQMAIKRAQTCRIGKAQILAISEQAFTQAVFAWLQAGPVLTRYQH
jgi:transcriptional regulator with XRE-family HTH domain